MTGENHGARIGKSERRGLIFAPDFPVLWDYTGGMANTRPENGAERNGAAADTDRVLLTRFVRDGDEGAFAEIVRRHSSLVFGVCHRTLRDRQAAEDAFQATFLVLAQSAGRIRRRTSLGSWLHGVACRVSLRALAKRQRRREKCCPMNTISTEPTLQDVGEIYEQQLLDAELRELPEKYREPLVLHYLQGLSNQQVADRLDVSVSCVEGRVKRGKKELRLRLTRRGMELGVALTAVHLTSAAAQAGALESLITSTAHIAASQTLNSTVAAAVPTEAARQLAAKEIAMLATAKTSILVSSVAAVVITAGIVAGVNSSTQSAHADGQPGLSSSLPLIDSQLDASLAPPVDSVELAQSGLLSGAASDDTLEGETENLQRAIQALRDELTALQMELDDRTAQQQAADAAAQDLEDDLDAERELADMGGGMAMAGIGGMEAMSEPYQSFDFSESDPQTQQIQAALEESVSIEFPGNALSDVLDYLSLANEIPILFDETRLADAGISADEEVSLVISGVTLQNALDIMLNNLSGVQLDYIVENQVLKITTAEQAASVMETRVYSLGQLPADYRPDEIARVIIRTIAPETWRNSVIQSEYDYGGVMDGAMGDEDMYELMSMEEVQPVGGPGAGSIEPLPGVLVVTQSQRVHRQIVDLLSQLKRQYEVTRAGVGGEGMMEEYGSGGFSGDASFGAGAFSSDGDGFEYESGGSGDSGFGAEGYGFGGSDGGVSDFGADGTVGGEDGDFGIDDGGSSDNSFGGGEGDFGESGGGESDIESGGSFGEGDGDFDFDDGSSLGSLFGEGQDDFAGSAPAQ